MKANIRFLLHQGMPEAEFDKRLCHTRLNNEATATGLISDARNNYLSEMVLRNPTSAKHAIDAHTNKNIIKEKTALHNPVKEKFPAMATGYKRSQQSHR